MLTIEELTAKARDMLLQYGEHYPTMFLEFSDERLEIVQIAGEFGGPMKRLQMYILGNQFGADKPGLAQVSFVVEAWMSRLKPGDTYRVQPSQDPNRVEILTITQVSLVSGYRATVSLEMKRDAAGKLIDAVDLHPGDPGQPAPHSIVDEFVKGYEAATLPKGRGDEHVQ